MIYERNLSNLNEFWLETNEAMLRLRNTHTSYGDTSDVRKLRDSNREVEQSKSTFSSHPYKQLLPFVVAGPLKTETAPRSAWKQVSEARRATKLVAPAGDTETVACSRNKKTSASRLPNLTFSLPRESPRQATGKLKGQLTKLDLSWSERIICLTEDPRCIGITSV
jgi:hypothetical protein